MRTATHSHSRDNDSSANSSTSERADSVTDLLDSQAQSLSEEADISNNSTASITAKPATITMDHMRSAMEIIMQQQTFYSSDRSDVITPPADNTSSHPLVQEDMETQESNDNTEEENPQDTESMDIADTSTEYQGASAKNTIAEQGVVHHPPHDQKTADPASAQNQTTLRSMDIADVSAENKGVSAAHTIKEQGVDHHKLHDQTTAEPASATNQTTVRAGDCRPYMTRSVTRALQHPSSPARHATRHKKKKHQMWRVVFKQSKTRKRRVNNSRTASECQASTSAGSHSPEVTGQENTSSENDA